MKRPSSPLAMSETGLIELPVLSRWPCKRIGLVLLLLELVRMPRLELRAWTRLVVMH
jgi:hypothetical protein